VRTWFDQLRVYQKTAKFDIDVDTGIVTLIVGTPQRWTYESLIFTREFDDEYALGYLALPDPATRTLHALQDAGQQSLACRLEDALRENDAIDNSCITVGFSMQADLASMYPAVEVMTMALLRNVLH